MPVYATMPSARPRCLCGDLMDPHASSASDCPKPRLDIKARTADRRAAARHTRQHLQRCMAARGVTVRLLAELTGVDARALRMILSGYCRQVTRTAFDAIAAYSVDAVRATARLQHSTRLARSIYAQGWDAEWQADRYGQNIEWVRQLLAGELADVSGEEADRIHSAADWLDGAWRRGQLPWGPALSCVTDAQRRGWHPLAYYDEETGEHGGARPDLERVAADACLLGAHRPRRKDCAEYPPNIFQRAKVKIEALHLSLQGLTAEVIGERLEVTDRTVQRWRTEAGLRYRSVGRRFELAPESRERAAELAAAFAAYDAAAYPDPVATLHRVGITTFALRTSSTDAVAA